ncbi:LysR family transcriptional regulator [Azospirillum sp. ST 5-10]|uniref:LysR family transcriptional regulator n=1 Tax=unclassified Azospirillum TaxID=2630922 RepID=UPI003F4A2AB1
MTLEQLRIFVAVAEREHVTQAARALNLTQSAVSAAVSALEARYATRLFDRVGRRIVLTEAGRLFLGEARAVLARAAAAETVLADVAGLARGTLRLAASQTVANYWLPPLLHRYRVAHPGIALSLAIGNTEGVAAMIHDGVAEFGLVEGTVEDPALSVTPVAEDELVLVVAAPLAGELGGSVAPADLRRMRWVFRERGSGTRAVFEDALGAAGVAASDLDIVLELPSNEAVRSAVEHGAGAAVLSRLAVAGALRSGALVALDLALGLALPRRRFFALRHRERAVTRAERALLDLLPFAGS